MSVARGLTLVDARPGERGQGEDVDLVVDMVAVFAAVDVDVVAGFVLGGGGQDAEVGAAVGDVEGGFLSVPGAAGGGCVEGCEVEDVDFAEGDLCRQS